MLVESAHILRVSKIKFEKLSSQGDGGVDPCSVEDHYALLNWAEMHLRRLLQY
jgi:hypothetical protein